jgi:hypothetical protein
MNVVQGDTTVIQCYFLVFTVELCEIVWKTTVELCEIVWKTTVELCGMFANHRRIVWNVIHRKNCVKPHPKRIPPHARAHISWVTHIDQKY